MKADRRRDDAADAPPVAIDLDGIVRRVAPFPVPEGRFCQIASAAGGNVVWSVLPIPARTAAAGTRSRPDASSCSTSRRVRTGGGRGCRQLRDRRRSRDPAAAREGKRLRASPPPEGASTSRRGRAPPEAPSRKSGWIDLARIRVSVDPRLEWRQMLREVWRLQRDQFWDAGMSGVDWAAVSARYAAAARKVATRAELSDLIWELQGELGTSHAYESGGDHRQAAGSGARPPWPPTCAASTPTAATRSRASSAATPGTRPRDSPLNAVGVEAAPATASSPSAASASGRRLPESRPGAPGRRQRSSSASRRPAAVRCARCS